MLSLFDQAVARAEPLVLATVIRTGGSTYSKAGAQMLIAADGESAGLLSGGCLEADLMEHARAVLTVGAAKRVHYDSGAVEDPVFGLGSGCEGAMDILLQRLDAASGWQPMKRLTAAWRRQHSEALLLVVQSAESVVPAGSGLFLGDGMSFGMPSAANAIQADLQGIAASMLQSGGSRLLGRILPGIELFALQQPAPARILVLGGGADAQPVVDFAVALGWQVTLVDHRSYYARRERFPGAAAVLGGGPAALAQLLMATVTGSSPYAAAIVMSHHLSSDRDYLQELAHTEIPFVGLLGPPARRERLLTALGDSAARLRGRLRAPVGLDLGAASPEAIALAIVAEIQGTMTGRVQMGPMSTRQPGGT